VVPQVSFQGQGAGLSGLLDGQAWILEGGAPFSKKGLVSSVVVLLVRFTLGCWMGCWGLLG